MKSFWKREQPSLNQKEEEALNKIRTKVEERKILFDEIKSNYLPQNDQKINISYFMFNVAEPS